MISMNNETLFLMSYNQFPMVLQRLPLVDWEVGAAVGKGFRHETSPLQSRQPITNRRGFAGAMQG